MGSKKFSNEEMNNRFITQIEKTFLNFWKIKKYQNTWIFNLLFLQYENKKPLKQNIMNNYFNQNPSNGWNRLAEDFVSLIKVAVKEAVDASIQDKMYENVVFDQKLTTKQLCERWKISDTTLLTWEKKGVITPIQTGGKKKLYSLKDVREAEMNGYIKNVA